MAWQHLPGAPCFAKLSPMSLDLDVTHVAGPYPAPANPRLEWTAAGGDCRAAGSACYEAAERRPLSRRSLDARSHMARSPARSKQFGRRAGIIGIALGIVGIANFVIYAARKVAEGHGLDFYMSGSGAKTTYI